ncbi:MAG: hypothetical protein AAB492_01005 [Patescibacteria group bacterium]
MPIVLRSHYGKKPLPKGEGFMKVTPTKQRFVEEDHTDIRLDRIRIFDGEGKFVRSFLQDPLGRRFVDNLKGTEDDVKYIRSLSRESKT